MENSFLHWLEDESTALPFAYALANQMQNSGVSVHRSREVNPLFRKAASPGIATAYGQLNLSHGTVGTKVSAECWFTIDSNWATNQPSLRCFEPWLRGVLSNGARDLDWHYYKDNSLCFVLRDQWEDELSSELHGRGKKEMIQFAAFFAANNARWLLFHHLEGYRRRLTKWDPSWPQWRHGDEGRKDYELWKKQDQAHKP